MKSSKSAFGALHPILFFIGVYVIALFCSIFICSTVFYTLNRGADEVAGEINNPATIHANTYQASVASMH